MMMELARATTIAEIDPLRTPAFAPGEIIADAYVVRGILGAGGMGQVYAADDRELQRPVAIKTTRDGGAMLRREAQALAQVHHPNVVAVHRVGMHRGAAFMVMERLFGATLADHMRDREVELDEALAILGGIADGLSALHQAGIAHLDLKPGNVILCANKRVVLVDLGIMVPEVVAGAREPCGTPLYMAPELIECALAPGRACRADFYSFGALAFELLAGEPPFTGVDVPAVLARHLVDPPPDLCAIRGDVPARLGALVRACLAKDAMDRPGTAEEIAWELRAIRARVARDTGRMQLRR